MIELETFKKNILNNIDIPKVIIAGCKGTGEFIFHQYLNHFAASNNLSIEAVDEIPVGTPPIFEVSNEVVKTVTIDDKISIKALPNEFVWIKCGKIPKEIKTAYADNCVEFPEIEDWQLRDYILSVTNLSEQQVSQLLNSYKDPFRVQSELDKLCLFTDQADAYNKIVNQIYIETSPYVIFDLVNAVVNRDEVALSKIWPVLNTIDVDVFGFMKLLITNFKRVIMIQLGKYPTAESTGMKSSQFWAIKNRSCNKYSREQLINIYQFLTDCDYCIKTGKVDATLMVDYIIIKIFSM